MSSFASTYFTPQSVKINLKFVKKSALPLKIDQYKVNSSHKEGEELLANKLRLMENQVKIKKLSLGKSISQ